MDINEDNSPFLASQTQIHLKVLCNKALRLQRASDGQFGTPAWNYKDWLCTQN